MEVYSCILFVTKDLRKRHYIYFCRWMGVKSEGVLPIVWPTMKIYLPLYDGAVNWKNCSRQHQLWPFFMTYLDLLKLFQKQPFIFSFFLQNFPLSPLQNDFYLFFIYFLLLLLLSLLLFRQLCYQPDIYQSLRKCETMSSLLCWTLVCGKEQKLLSFLYNSLLRLFRYQVVTLTLLG